MSEFRERLVNELLESVKALEVGKIEDERLRAKVFRAQGKAANLRDHDEFLVEKNEAGDKATYDALKLALVHLEQSEALLYGMDTYSTDSSPILDDAINGVIRAQEQIDKVLDKKKA